jgi:hypothetical protein
MGKLMKTKNVWWYKPTKLSAKSDHAHARTSQKTCAPVSHRRRHLWASDENKKYLG